MAFGDFAPFERIFYPVREHEQSECVGDRNPRAADPFRYVGLREVELVDELSIGGRFLQRGKVRADDILDQCELQLGLKGDIHDDDWNFIQPRELRGAPAAFARDQNDTDPERRPV